jgi:hypothetical protein
MSKSNLSASEMLAYSTVRIECEFDNGSGTGTGFFFQFLNDPETGTHIPVVITNKHVVTGAKKGRLIISKKDANGNPNDNDHFQVFFENFESLWRMHPLDDVDLCAMPIGPFLNEADKKGDNLFYIPLDKSLIPSQEQLNDLDALEEILMIGYPNGIWDETNNQPIFRKGVTATHPSKNYGGKQELMIDAACFPGSSGSPVFIFNNGGYVDKKGNTRMGSTRIILLGALYAGPQHTAKGEIIIENVPVNQKPVPISRIPNNLGIVIKSERILELEKLFE